MCFCASDTLGVGSDDADAINCWVSLCGKHWYKYICIPLALACVATCRIPQNTKEKMQNHRFIDADHKHKNFFKLKNTILEKLFWKSKGQR